MKAAILAGGYGRRLRPITDTLPKPMIKLAGKPIVEWQIRWLRGFGINSIVLLTGYKKEKLVEYIDKKKKEIGVIVEFSDETRPLGTGGALKQAKSFLYGENFIMLNGDVITNIDLKRMKLDNCLASVALVPLKSPFGIAKLESNKIISFDEKPLLKEYWINAGVYLMNSKIFDYLPDEGDIEKTAFVKLAANDLLTGMKFDNVYWRSIDSIKDIEEVSYDLKNKKV